jgi:hypothetical protein
MSARAGMVTISAVNAEIRQPVQFNKQMLVLL